jgi:predicted AAA+ superfamily ATPase
MDDTDQPLFPRFSAELIATALKDTPVVMVTGPRQCGKTTLVRDFGRGQSRIHHHGRRHSSRGGTQRPHWVGARS